jgi:hypothetical protein
MLRSFPVHPEVSEGERETKLLILNEPNSTRQKCSPDMAAR